MAYATEDDVRLHTNLDTVDISDANITSLIVVATAQVNADIAVEEVREPIVYIDNTRQNLINGSNTTYYVQHWKEHISDMDDDGDVDKDDITVVQVDSTGTETTLTVSTITPDSGKFVLSASPTSGVRLYVTYKWTPISSATPHPLIKLATVFLTAAYCYAKLNVGQAPSHRFGEVSIARDMKSFEYWYSKYQQVCAQINNKMSDIRVMVHQT